MSHVIVDNINMNYPIYGANTRSLKHSIARVATGGILSKSSQGRMVVKALSNINFSLHAGDRLALVGHNGAGKSSLLKLLAGIYEPESGNVQIEGSIYSIFDLNFCLQPELTGYENIKLYSIILEKPQTELPQIIKDIEEFTELGDFLSVPVKTYSTGMSLRLTFSIATAFTPEILLVDEFISAADANFMEKAKNRMQEYVNRSQILILSSHEMDILETFCNKVLWLEHGEIKAFGNIDDILPAYKKHFDKKSMHEEPVA